MNISWASELWSTVFERQQISSKYIHIYKLNDIIAVLHSADQLIDDCLHSALGVHVTAHLHGGRVACSSAPGGVDGLVHYSGGGGNRHSSVRQQHGTWYPLTQYHWSQCTNKPSKNVLQTPQTCINSNFADSSMVFSIHWQQILTYSCIQTRLKTSKYTEPKTTLVPSRRMLTRYQNYDHESVAPLFVPPCRDWQWIILQLHVGPRVYRPTAEWR